MKTIPKAPLPLFLTILVCWLGKPAFSVAQSNTATNRFKIDVIGDSHWSRYNYTDLTVPYNGVDTWTELRLSYLMNRRRNVGVYGGVLFSNMFYIDNPNALVFTWQKHFQYGAGAQYYPFYKEPAKWKKRLPGGGYRPGFGIRLFAWTGWRHYYDCDESDERDMEKFDFQAGGDYFYENVTDSDILTLIAWSNASFRYTNFSHKKYNVLLWTGNVRAGPKWPTNVVGNIFFNVSTDWTLTSQCKCRWWENYLRFAGGISWFPFVNEDGKGWALFRRINLYADYYFHNNWLGENPNNKPQQMEEVQASDLRIGISFASPNLFRKNQ